MCISIAILSVSEFVLCVLGGGESEGVRSAEGEEGEEEEKKGGLRDLIIQRIDHPNDDVGCHTQLSLTYSILYIVHACMYCIYLLTYVCLGFHTEGEGSGIFPWNFPHYWQA